MIYVDPDYINRLSRIEGEEEIPPTPLFLNNPEEVIEFCISNNSSFDQDAYNSKKYKFAESYMKQVLPVTLRFYPQLRSKRKLLEDELFDDGMDVYEKVYDIHGYYIDGDSKCQVETDCTSGININEVDKFIHNRHYDYLLDNYEEWYKQRISFENIYVESFYAGVYIKAIHGLLLKMLHNYSPAILCLPDDLLDNIQANFTTDAWYAYYTVCRLDPDPLSDSTVLENLEDYEFDDLLNHKGPEIIRNAKGKIICIHIASRNKPKREKIPLICGLCKSYNNDDPTYFLCAVARVNRKNSSHFKCRAYEKFRPT